MHLIIHRETVGPALVRNRYERGQVAYLQFSHEDAYLGDYPLPEHRLLARNLVQTPLPAPPVSVSAPLNAESVITFDRPRNRFIVHFIGFIGVRDGQSRTSNEILVPVMAEMWRYQAQIKFLAPVKRAYGHGSGTHVRVQGKAVSFDTSQIHEAPIVDL